MSVSLVAGLGNPGKAYEKTRHNSGFIVLDALAAKLGLAWKHEPAFEADVARWDKSPGTTWLLAKPRTFMNGSGRALRHLVDFYKVPVASVIVIHDDLTIDLGRLKVSTTGSDGGHNGIASLLEHLGDGFARFRIGIGAKHPPEIDLSDYVLGKFLPDEQTIIDQQLTTFVDGIRLLIDSGSAKAMNTLNRRSP